MKNKMSTAHDAVKRIRPGDIVAIGGVGRSRVPMGLVREIARQRIGDLHLIGREVGMDFDLLIGAGLVRHVSAAYVGLEEMGLAPNFRRATEAGRLKISEHACRTVMLQIRAGAMGMPHLPVKGMLGSDVMRVNPQDLKEITCPFTGERLVAVRAVVPDVAIIHAQRADCHGNVQIRGARFEDGMMAQAAKMTIVSVEEIVPIEFIKEDPERTTIPHMFVDAVVHMPRGAHPASCHMFYGSDRDHVIAYAEASRTPAGFQTYVDKYVHAVADEAQYAALIAAEVAHV